MTRILCLLLAILIPGEILGAGQKSMKFFSYNGVIDNGTLTVLVDESNQIQASYSPSPYAKKKAWSKKGSLAPERTQTLFGLLEQVKVELLPAAKEVLRPGEATHSFMVGAGKTLNHQFSFKLNPLTPKQKALISAIGAEVHSLK